MISLNIIITSFRSLKWNLLKPPSCTGYFMIKFTRVILPNRYGILSDTVYCIWINEQLEIIYLKMMLIIISNPFYCLFIHIYNHGSRLCRYFSPPMFTGSTLHSAFDRTRVWISRRLYINRRSLQLWNGTLISSPSCTAPCVFFVRMVWSTI